MQIDEIIFFKISNTILFGRILEVTSNLITVSVDENQLQIANSMVIAKNNLSTWIWQR